jgi:hypothetical protein
MIAEERDDRVEMILPMLVMFDLYKHGRTLLVEQVGCSVQDRELMAFRARSRA